MGLSGRLIASYILVTLGVVVLIEALVFGFEVPQLLYGTQVQTQLQAQVNATAKSYAQRFSQPGSGGVRTGTVLGDPGQPPSRSLTATTPSPCPSPAGTRWSGWRRTSLR